MPSPLAQLAAIFQPFAGLGDSRVAGGERASVLSAEPEIARGLSILEAMLRGAPGPGAPPPEESADPYERLRAAMETLREVEVTYTRALDGASGTYRLKPYELGYHPMSGRPVLWAQVEEGTGAPPLHASDPSTGGIHTDTIHALLEDRISWDTLRVTERTYSPDWAVQPKTVG